MRNYGNLMIKHDGALGDQGFTIPALRLLRKSYNKVYLFGSPQAVVALSGTNLVDRFIIRPDNWYELSIDSKRDWLNKNLEDISFDASINFNGGILPGRYMYHKEDPNFNAPAWWIKKKVESISFFDAYSEHAGVRDAIGKRPVIDISSSEKFWLEGFRNIYKIPDDAFLLGWQFTGSSFIKWYPFFDEVIQRGIMKKYPWVYVIGLGDISNKFKWDIKYHGGRFINLGNSVSFREAYILTSILNCLVSPETGIMVFAQAWSHVPKVLLATHTYGYHYTFGETYIVQSEANCSPCYRIVESCKHDGNKPWSLCMGRISPERVFSAIENVVNRFN